MSLINAGAVLGGREAADIKAQIATKLNTADAPATVRDTALTGLSTATATPVTAADTVLTGVGKLQAQVDLKLDIADYNDRFLGLFSSVFDLEAAHPTANAGDYAQVDLGIGSDVIIYAWDVSDAKWAAVGSSAIANTDALPEGSSNLYHTGQRVRGTALTGLSTATAAPVTAADTVLTAAGKLQRQATDNAANSRLRFILTSTWASLPAANSVPTGTRYFVTDIGVSGSDWYSNGTRWQLVGGRIVLAMSNTAIAVTGVTGVTPATTITIPAGVMGSNGTLEITSLWSCPNNANTKSCSIFYGGANYMAAALTSALSNQMLTIIRNRTANSQIGGVGATAWVYGSIDAAVKKTTADTTVAQNITFNAVHSNTSDTITLESYRVDLIV